MSASPCPRLFEAEALRDGRLNGAGKASFERHVTACAACAREVAVFEAVEDALRSIPTRPANQLHVRRERTRLLAAFDRELLTPRRSMLTRGRVVWCAAVVALACAVLLAPRMRRDGERARTSEAAHAIIHADVGTAWSHRMDHEREIITLERGALWVHVDHSHRARRLVVVLPDGELEDTGTTFVVNVDRARTTRVAVREGSVILHFHGQPAVAVGAGDVWTPAPPQAPSAAASSHLPSEATDAPSPIAMPRSPASAPTPAHAPSPGRDPFSDFQDAVAALHRGDDHEAAVMFAGFLAKHPRDPRAEDAAYLRVIALQRGGDDRGMRDAATAYIRRYPEGFRRREIESLLR